MMICFYQNEFLLLRWFDWPNVWAQLRASLWTKSWIKVWNRLLSSQFMKWHILHHVYEPPHEWSYDLYLWTNLCSMSCFELFVFVFTKSCTILFSSLYPSYIPSQTYIFFFFLFYFIFVFFSSKLFTNFILLLRLF